MKRGGLREAGEEVENRAQEIVKKMKVGGAVAERERERQRLSSYSVIFPEHCSLTYLASVR